MIFTTYIPELEKFWNGLEAIVRRHTKDSKTKSFWYIRFMAAEKWRLIWTSEFFPVKRKLIQRVMRLMGLESITPKTNTSRQPKGHKIYPYLLKKMSITEPDQVWCSDITYIRLAHGFVYLTAVMDWASRYVLTWEVSVTMDDDFCVNALEECLAQA